MRRKDVLEENHYITQVAGVLKGEILEKIALQQITQTIIVYPGAIQHMKKRHPHAFRLYFRKIPEILAYPDFIGLSGKDGQKRIEVVKQYKDSILLALKYNDKGELFVSSMYIIEEKRIEKRKSYGRLIPIAPHPGQYHATKQRYRNTNKIKRR